MKIYAIVVTYKGMQWYDRCFTSLRNSTIPVQTIVVDNASGDGTVEYIREHYPEVLLIESKENLGFGKGNNLALKYAYEHNCDYVFLLNQDAWLVMPDTLENLVNISINNSEYGILSPLHLSIDEKSLNMGFESDSNAFSSHYLRGLFCGIVSDIYETDYVNAAAWLLPRKTLSTLGGFDPLFFHYGEDDDYINRAKYHKIKIGICPLVRVIHDHCDNNRIGNSINLQEQASLDNLTEFLDLNKHFNYYCVLFHLFLKYIKAIFYRNNNKRKFYFNRMFFLFQMKHAIANSRQHNKKTQPNWIQNNESSTIPSFHQKY